MILMISTMMVAQSAINSWDLLGHQNSIGKEIKVTDNYIWGIGEAFGSDILDWGMHVTAYHQDGTYHQSEFITGEDFLPNINEIYGMVALEADELFFCYSGTYKKSDCVVYNLENRSFTSMALQDTSTQNTLRPRIISDFEKTPIVVATVRDQNSDLIDSIAIITYDNGEKQTDYIKVSNNNYTIKSVVPLTENKCKIAIRYNGIRTDILDIEDGEVINTVIQSQLIPSAIIDMIEEDEDFIFTSSTASSETGTQLFRPAIKKIDSEGNTIWVKDMKDEMGQVAITGQVAYHYLLKIIPAIEGDGYIYSGSEDSYTAEDGPLSYSYGVVGKISLDGEILWHKRYAVTDSTGYNYNIDDIEPDGFGGYLTYGTAKHNPPGHFRWAAWMMRIDKDGNLIDDEVNNINYELNSSIILSPNPTSDFIKMSEKIKEVQILNSRGEIIYQLDELIDNSTIDISQYPEGNYFLTGIDTSGLRVRKSFVIVRE